MMARRMAALGTLACVGGLVWGAGCGSPPDRSAGPLTVWFGDAEAWVDLMPGAGAPTIVIFPVGVKNTTGLDLEKLRIEQADVMLAGRVIISVAPQVCLGPELCHWSSHPLVDEINLEKGAEVRFTMRIDASGVFEASEQSDPGHPRPFSLKLRFRMTGDGYRSDLFETGEIVVASFPE
jgi:hypothetical protein